MIYDRLKNWVVELICWVAETRLVILWCLVLILAFLVGFYTSPSELSIRSSGYALQLLGMLFAIRGVLSIRAHFGHPTFKKLSVEWLRRFPKWTRETNIHVGAASIGISGMSADLEIWVTDNPSDPLENRVNEIVKNLERLREEQKQNSKQISQLKECNDKRHEEQDLLRINMEKELRNDYESLHTDDIFISLIGLLWLTVGISMSTMSQELFGLIR